MDKTKEKEIIKIEYLLESDDMTDEQYDNQPELIFIVTEEMLIELLQEKVDLPDGYRICENNFYISKIN